MKSFLALVLCCAVPSAVFASDGGYKIAYDGGSVSGLKTGNELRLYIDGSNVRLMRDKQEALMIPAAAITEISYGQDVHRRVVPPLDSQWFRLASER